MGIERSGESGVGGAGRLTLAVEISNPTSAAGREAGRLAGASVAVGRVRSASEVEVLAAEPVAAASRESDDLFPALERVMAASGVERGAIERVAVSVGPGGYTAVRIGCAAGALIAHSLGRPGVAVLSAAVAAVDVVGGERGGVGTAEEWRPVGEAAANEGHAGGSYISQFLQFIYFNKLNGVCVALASKGESVWLTGFARDEADGRLMYAEGLVDAGGFSALEPGKVLVDGHFPAVLRRAAEERGWEMGRLELDAVRCLRASALFPDCSAAELIPRYPRPPEAVRLWNTRRETRS